MASIPKTTSVLSCHAPMETSHSDHEMFVHGIRVLIASWIRAVGVPAMPVGGFSRSGMRLRRGRAWPFCALLWR
jgi:hypothetical protein